MCNIGRRFERSGSIAGHILTLAALSVLAACSQSPVAPAGPLDTRLAWPCDRVVLSWEADARQLQAHLDESQTVWQSDGVAELRLDILKCRTASYPDAAALSYALVTIPVTAASAPIRVTGVHPGGSLALQYVLADVESIGLFRNLGYATRSAVVHLDIAVNGRGVSFEAGFQSDGGDLLATGEVAYEPDPHGTTEAVYWESVGTVSVLFGEELAQRHLGVAVNIDGAVNTLLPGLGLADAQASVIVDQQLFADRVFWRIAK